LVAISATNYPQSWNSRPRQCRPGTGICGERGSIRTAYPALPSWPGTREKENKPRDHTRHPHPKTAKHQATETAIK
jgi:hypothetical protein